MWRSETRFYLTCLTALAMAAGLIRLDPCPTVLRSEWHCVALHRHAAVPMSLLQSIDSGGLVVLGRELADIVGFFAIA